MDQPGFLTALMERFATESPLVVMTRATMEQALNAAELDALFERESEEQYLRELTFSTTVDLMGSVVLRSHRSINAAYKASPDSVGVSVTSVYNKVNGVEPKVSSALVAHSAGKPGSVIEHLGGQLPPLLSGYRLRIIDGNHLAATQRRLKVLRGSVAGPLPGQSLAVLCPSRMLITDLIACEDGHAQERSLTEEILQLVKAGDAWMADRNFCTARILSGIAERKASFIIRQHASNVAWEPAGEPVHCGTTDTGEVFEQKVVLLFEHGPLEARRITIKLKDATRDGDRALHILTNLPASVPAVEIAVLYRQRWTLETAFKELTEHLRCEVSTLGYPRAALFAFALAVVAYNALSTVKAALRAEHGHEVIEQDLSGYYVADEISGLYRAMMILLPPPAWVHFRQMSAQHLAEQLRACARHVKLRKYKKSKRGPKKPVPARTRFKGKSHISTAKLLESEHR